MRRTGLGALGLAVVRRPRAHVALTWTKRRAYDPTMTLKNAALFALIGIILLTVLLAAGFIRDFSGFLSGAIAAVALLKSGIKLLASLSVAVFLYVFHKAQS